MEKLVDEGLCKNISVSNFTSAQILDLLQNGCEKYKPAVLQNECHLYIGHGYHMANYLSTMAKLKTLAFEGRNRWKLQFLPYKIRAHAPAGEGPG